ncbi:MAG: Hpt domain-containing protein, partial [Pseudomonadales bacterium]|nr:Hpt domain-containing protein [Pseudomonadales bacterium]
RNTPVIAQTANTMSKDDEFYAVGMTEYIEKPVEHERLAQVIKRVLPDKEKGGGPVATTARETQPEVTPDNSNAGYQSDGKSWDKESLMNRVRGNETQLSRLVEIFLESVPADIDELDRQLQSSDFGTAAAVVHGIKGTAANMGGVRLHQILQNLEAACKAENLSDIHALRERAEIEIKILTDEMNQFIHSRGTDHSL